MTKRDQFLLAGLGLAVGWMGLEFQKQAAATDELIESSGKFAYDNCMTNNEINAMTGVGVKRDCQGEALEID